MLWKSRRRGLRRTWPAIWRSFWRKPLKKSPRALAEDLRKTLEGELEDVEAISVAGAGFLNFRWSLGRLQGELQTLLAGSEDYGKLPEAAGQKILIEFVSANPTGPLHVGMAAAPPLGIPWLSSCRISATR